MYDYSACRYETNHKYVKNRHKHITTSEYYSFNIAHICPNPTFTQICLLISTFAKMPKLPNTCLNYTKIAHTHNKCQKVVTI